MNRTLVIGALMLFAASPAIAKPSTTVFPFSAPNLPMKIADAPIELAKALADELDGSVANIPIEEAAAIAGCDPEATTCLEQVSKSVKSKRIVFGSIAHLDGGRLKVTLTRFDPGPDRQQRTYTVEGSVREMSEELVELSRSLFGEEEEEPEGPDDTGPPGSIDPIPPDDRGGRGGGGGVSGTTYVIMGVGGAVTAAGIGFLINANQIANEVKTLPRMTTADFQRLTLKEQQGQQRMMIGGVLLGVGVVGLLYGTVRILQEKSVPAKSDAVSRLTPVPIEGGAALVYTMELP